MNAPELKGFHYDSVKARFLADLWQTQLPVADQGELTAADRLAAVGFLAARIMLDSGFRAIPSRASQALADFIAHVVSVEGSSAPPPPPRPTGSSS